MAKTNSNFLCGLPSSSKLHNPAIRRINRTKKKARMAALVARLEHLHKERERHFKELEKHREQVAVAEKRPSRVGRFFGQMRRAIQELRHG